MRKDIRMLFALALCLPATAVMAQKLEKLNIFREEYPRAGYFRIAEFSIRQQYSGQEDKYEKWSERMSDLDGIMGKTEYEELVKDNPHEQICR